MKMLGIIIICTCSAALGFKQGEACVSHYRELVYLKRIMLLIRGEIRYNCGVLSEVFSNVAGRIKEPYSGLFISLGESLDSGSGRLFADIWNEEVLEKLSGTALHTEDIEGLRELGEAMGYLDMEMQLNSIDFYTDRLNERIESTKESLKGNVRLFKVLGIMGGALIAVLLV